SSGPGVDSDSSCGSATGASIHHSRVQWHGPRFFEFAPEMPQILAYLAHSPGARGESLTAPACQGWGGGGGSSSDSGTSASASNCTVLSANTTNLARNPGRAPTLFGSSP